MKFDNEGINSIKKLILFFIVLINLIMFLTTETSKGAYKKLDKYFKKTYGEEFVIHHVGLRKVNNRKWYEAGLVYPKSYIGTHKENDPYYWGKGFVDNEGPGDNYGAVLLKETANNFYLPKLKELFGENVLPVFDLEGYYEEKDFEKEIARRNEYYKIEDGNFNSLVGRIYIFGRVRNEEDKEWYRKQIYEFINFMRKTDTFEYVQLGINIVDERILADNSLSYIEKIEKIENVDKDFNILNEPFEKTSKEDIKLKIENMPRTNTYKFLNEYRGYLLYTNIISPKKQKYEASKKTFINKYESFKDITFEGEVFIPKFEGNKIKELGEDETYFITEIKNNMKNGTTKQYNKDDKLIWESTYKDNLLDGKVKSYTRRHLIEVSDTPLEEGTYINGKLEGEYRIFDRGKIEWIKLYKNGKLDGVSKKFFFDGRITCIEPYKDGELNGIYKKFYKNGNLQEESHYKAGKLDGKQKLFNNKGTLYIDADYKDGELSGIYKKFYENGNLQEESEYKDGKLNGIQKNFYENGNLEEESEYKNGYPYENTVFKKYFENGNLKNILKFENNKIVGEEKFYYPNGKLYIINFYEKDNVYMVKKKVFNENEILIREIFFDNEKWRKIVKIYREDDGSLERIYYYDCYDDIDTFRAYDDYDYKTIENIKYYQPMEEYDRDGKLIKTEKSPNFLKNSKEIIKKKFTV